MKQMAAIQWNQKGILYLISAARFEMDTWGGTGEAAVLYGSRGGAIGGACRWGLSHTTMHHLRHGFVQKRAGKVGILNERFSAVGGSVLGCSTVAGLLLALAMA
jgi:hypothetical protein